MASNRNFTYNGYDDAHYKHIPDNGTISISGTGNVVIDHVGNNVTIKQSGAGTLTIPGTVGNNAVIEITGTDDTYITRLGNNAKVIHSGYGQLMISGIGNHAYILLNGTNDTSIGNIGTHAKIEKDGCGDLKLTDSMGEHSTLTISGTGDVKFSQRPPASVIKRIKHSGIGSLSMPGGFRHEENSDSDSGNVDDSDDNLDSMLRSIITGRAERTSYETRINSGNGFVTVTINGVTKRYPGNSGSLLNGRVMIDGRYVDDNNIPSSSNNIFSNNVVSSSIIHIRSAAVPSSRVNIAPAPAPLAAAPEPIAPAPRNIKQEKQDAFLKQCSPHVQTYAARAQIETMATKIKTLELTAAEEKRFEKFIDPITEEYMEIPVYLHERYYDLSTLVTMEKMADPTSREAYSHLEIGPGRKLMAKLDKRISELKITREKNQSAVASNTEEDTSTYEASSAPLFRR